MEESTYNLQVVLHAVLCRWWDGRDQEHEEWPSSCYSTVRMQQPPVLALGQVRVSSDHKAGAPPRWGGWAAGSHIRPEGCAVAWGCECTRTLLCTSQRFLGGVYPVMPVFTRHTNKFSPHIWIAHINVCSPLQFSKHAENFDPWQITALFRAKTFKANTWCSAGIKIPCNYPNHLNHLVPA